jgi:hypothetical protein
MRFFRFFFVVLACCAVSIASAQSLPNAKGKAAPKKESVQFDGETLVLASEEKDDTQKLREFIPVDQKLESWTKLASIREYDSDKSPAENVEVFKNVLKEKYPQTSTTVTDNPQTDEAIIDFLVWADDRSFVEFNVFKYRRAGAKGIFAEQYAVREYKDPQGFLKTFKPTRDRLVDLMTNEGLKINKQ